MSGAVKIELSIDAFININPGGKSAMESKTATNVSTAANRVGYQTGNISFRFAARIQVLRKKISVLMFVTPAARCLANVEECTIT